MPRRNPNFIIGPAEGDTDHDRYNTLTLRNLLQPGGMTQDEGVELRALMLEHPSTCARCHDPSDSPFLHLHPSYGEPCSFFGEMESVGRVVVSNSIAT